MSGVLLLLLFWGGVVGNGGWLFACFKMYFIGEGIQKRLGGGGG